MHVLARLAGPNGEICVLEDASTGARLYREGGVSQSRVLPGGEADVKYIHLMAALLEGGAEVLLLGCGGGALATMLHRRGEPRHRRRGEPDQLSAGADVLLDAERRSSASWPTCASSCARQRRTFDAIGIDVGGPRFSYEEVLTPATIARVRHALRAGGRIAANISLEVPDDPVPGRIADRLAAEGFEVWAFGEAERSDELNVVLLASARREVAIRARGNRRRKLVACPADGTSPEQPATSQGAQPRTEGLAAGRQAAHPPT